MSVVFSNVECYYKLHVIKSTITSLITEKRSFTVPKKGLKSLYGAFSTPRPPGSIVFLTQQVPAFISRGATHHTDARDLYKAMTETISPNFAETWDILFYFLSEVRHTEDFQDARKIQRLRPELYP
jgi:hypothetical protein